MDMRNPGIEQAVKPLDQTNDFEFQFVGPGDGPVYGGVQGRGIAAGGKDSDASHEIFLNCLQIPRSSAGF